MTKRACVHTPTLRPGQWIGATISLSVFFSMLAGIFLFHGLIVQNLWTVLPVLALYLLIFVGLPRAIRHPFLEDLSSGAQLSAHRINDAVVGIALFVTYLVGVGLAAIFIRLSGSNRLRMRETGATAWKNAPTESENEKDFENMF